MKKPKVKVTYKIGFKTSSGWRYEIYNDYETALAWLQEQLEWYDQASFKRERKFILDDDL